MRFTTLGSALALSMAFAAGSIALPPSATSAYAQGGGHGGGNGGGGNGSAGNGGGNGSGGSNSGHSASGNGGNSGRASSNFKSSSTAKEKSETETRGYTQSSKKNAKTNSTADKTTRQMAGLNSLNRNYRALLHTSDPRMAGIAAYATAYARYELKYGVSPTEEDPLLGDDALEDALASATKTGTVSPVVLEKAKAILGVGDAYGKIDQIRYSLEQQTPDYVQTRQ